MVDRGMPAHAYRFCCIDFETTGHVKGMENRPWQVGMCYLQQGQIDLAGLDQWIHVPLDHRFNGHAPGIYATMRDTLNAAPTAAEVWPMIHRNLAGSIAVAHNIGTERTQLARMAPMTDYGPWVDTLKVSRRVYPGLRSYALDDLIDELGLLDQLQALVPGRMAHDAYYDAVACALLLHTILSAPTWRDALLEDLL